MFDQLLASAAAVADAEPQANRGKANDHERRNLCREPGCPANHIVQNCCVEHGQGHRCGSQDSQRLPSQCQRSRDVNVAALAKVLAAAPTIAARARLTDRSWWLEQTLLSPGVSEIAWPQAWRALKIRAPETTHPLHFWSYAAALEAACAGHGVLPAPLPFSEREFSSGRLSRLSKIRLPSRIGYSLLMRRELANTSRGRALRRRIIATIKPAERS
jgi:DNA-binding transcriptional LysR family regulator